MPSPVLPSIKQIVYAVSSVRSFVGSSWHFVAELHETDESSLWSASHLSDASVAVSSMKKVVSVTVSVSTSFTNSYSKLASTSISDLPSKSSIGTGRLVGGTGLADPQPTNTKRMQARDNMEADLFIVNTS